MRKLALVPAILALTLTGCGGPPAGDLRQKDPEGDTACIHLGGGLSAGGELGETNMRTAAAHAAKASTELIRQAASVDASGTAQIPDVEAFKKACESEGFEFK